MKDCTIHPNYIKAKKKSAKTLRKKFQDRYKNNPKFCLNCDKELEYTKRKNKFCNYSCAAQYNNKDRIISKKECYSNCKECGKKLNRTEHKQYKFCSQKCCNANHRSKEFEDITTKLNNGELNYLTTSNATPSKKRLKRIIEIRDGNRCSICSIPAEWEFKPLIMILDHIDGNSENNSLDNLRLVCSNCDSQLPTYKGRNIGNGRYKRRQRYAEGKSY